MLTVRELGINAKIASRTLSVAKASKNKALENISKALIENADYIIEQNSIDIKNL